MDGAVRPEQLNVVALMEAVRMAFVALETFQTSDWMASGTPAMIWAEIWRGLLLVGCAPEF